MRARERKSKKVCVLRESNRECVLYTERELARARERKSKRVYVCKRESGRRERARVSESERERQRERERQTECPR